MSDHNQFEKFLSLEKEKQERIINAAMKEFLVGYKKASTDNIVREAGISKGLLFHYFGTKERLYDFLIDYAIDTIQREYLDLINLFQTDILDSIWQLSLLKQDLSMRLPSAFDFITGVYVNLSTENKPTNGKLIRFKEIQATTMAEIYSHADLSLFRDDIDPKTALEIIGWALTGFAESKITGIPLEQIGKNSRENYDLYVEELKKILGIFRLCFYKK